MNKTFSQMLIEQTLTPEEIKAAFQRAEELSDDAGVNRTALGRAHDRTVDFIKKMDESAAADSSRDWYSQRLASMLGVKQSEPLSEAGIRDVFSRAAKGTASWLRDRGRDLTKSVTFGKLLRAWNQAGHPSDSATVAQLMRDSGVEPTLVDQILPPVQDSTTQDAPSDDDTAARAAFRDMASGLSGYGAHGGQFTGGEPTGSFETLGGDRYLTYPDGTTTRTTSGTGSRTRTQRTLFVPPGAADTLKSGQPAKLVRTPYGAEITNGRVKVRGSLHMKPGLVPLEFWSGERLDNGDVVYVNWRVGTPVADPEQTNFRDELSRASVPATEQPMDTSGLVSGEPTHRPEPEAKSPERVDFEKRLKAARQRQLSMTPNAIRKREARARQKPEGSGK